MAALDEELHEDTTSALPDLDDLIERMLEASGYDLTEPVLREGDEREIVTEFLAAREIKDAYERGSDELSAGDIGAAINGYRAIFDYLVSTRAAADADAEA
ncbi:MAG TPA: hypothetical protein VGH82_13020 [Gaiellaceae bacterium]